MGFFIQLTDAIAARQSLLVTGLDPNPEMLQSWGARRGLGGRSFLSQARHWIKAVIEATAPHVCAYKPSLGFYQALGPVGLELLLEVRDLVPRELPLIIDAKHGDLNSSSALAHYLFKELAADAVTLSPLAGQDIAAPFLLYSGKAVVMTCHRSLSTCASCVKPSSGPPPSNCCWRWVPATRRSWPGSARRRPSAS
jgi:uridine monophosphate synthetase